MTNILSQSSKTLGVSALALLALFSPSAFAHSNAVAEYSLVQGLLHPLLGADHLLALVAVGALAAMYRGKQAIAQPLVFATAMALGFVISLAGIAVPAVETGIALSVLILGIAALGMFRLNALLSLPLLTGFAMLHGAVHGAEMAATSAIAYFAGFMVSTLSVQWGSYTLIKKFHAAIPHLGQAIGGLISIAGAYFLLG